MHTAAVAALCLMRGYQLYSELGTPAAKAEAGGPPPIQDRLIGLGLQLLDFGAGYTCVSARAMQRIDLASLGAGLMANGVKIAFERLSHPSEALPNPVAPTKPFHSPPTCPLYEADRVNDFILL